MAKYTLRHTDTAAAFKITDTQTIALASDCLKSTEVISGTPTCNIARLVWTGANASSIAITRNAETILTINSSFAGELDFTRVEFIENRQNTSDITVTITGTAELYIVLRKEAGFATKIEPEQFGSYDNPAAAGS